MSYTTLNFKVEIQYLKSDHILLGVEMEKAGLL